MRFDAKWFCRRLSVSVPGFSCSSEPCCLLPAGSSSRSGTSRLGGGTRAVRAVTKIVQIPISLERLRQQITAVAASLQCLLDVKRLVFGIDVTFIRFLQ